MRTRPKLPTESEIATNKRLRLVCAWFRELNQRNLETFIPEGGLPETIIAEIEAKQFNPGDLMAIRQMPRNWDHCDPYKWLWILHRYQNGVRNSATAVRSCSFGQVKRDEVSLCS